VLDKAISIFESPGSRRVSLTAIGWYLLMYAVDRVLDRHSTQAADDHVIAKRDSMNEAMLICDREAPS
jgi:predicted proteasome-type protease